MGRRRSSKRSWSASGKSRSSRRRSRSGSRSRSDSRAHSSSRSNSAEFSSLLDPLFELDDLDTVYVRQKVRSLEMLLEMCCSWNVKNKFEVGSWNGRRRSRFKPLFVLEEDSNCCLRQCCQSIRPLEFNAYESSRSGHHLFDIIRPLRCSCCCVSATSGCLGRDYLEISGRNGEIMGDVRNIKNCCGTCDTGFSFLVCDADGREVCELIRKNCCVCSCGNDLDFDIHIDGYDTGCVVSKKYGGFLKEMFTD